MLRLMHDQKVKTLNIFYAVIGMFAVFYHMTNVINSLTPYLINKITSLLTVQKSSQHCEIICIWKTYLDSPIAEYILKLDGYGLIRAYHPGNMKRCGVCLFYKGNLLLRHIKTECFPQWLLCRVSIQNQTGNIVGIYRSPSHCNNQFNECLSNVERPLNNLKLVKLIF